MANRLKMAIVETIQSLHARGWSARRIARELGVDWASVARHLRGLRPDPNAAIAPIGISSFETGSNTAIAPLGISEVSEPSASDEISLVHRTVEAVEAVEPVEATDATDAVVDGPNPPPPPSPPRPLSPSNQGRRSACEPLRSVIEAALAQGLSAQRIYQDLVTDHGYAGSYYSVRRFVTRWSLRTQRPFRRMECEPGDEAQVDFGKGAPLVGPDGQRRTSHVLRVVLSHSRKGYSEAVSRQTTEAFLRCLENAFHHFGGVPRRIVLDNLRAAVTRADWFDPELNPKVEAFGRHYGTLFWPTKPYTPRHKGKVERGVGYVKGNALKGRTFAGLVEENRFLEEWERTVADRRIHGTIRQQVGPYFESAERAALLPLPSERFPSFEEGRRVVNRDGHIEVAKAYYSVPPEYLGRRIWVRWDSRVVRILNDRQEQIAMHPRHEPGRFSTHRPHIVSEKVNGIERGTAWMLGKIGLVGPHCAAWAQACLHVRGIEGVRAVQGLLSLSHRHRATAIDRACEIAHSYSAYRLRIVRRLIDRDEPKQLAFVDVDPIIRPLADYTRFVHNAIQKGASR
ncbi:MAG: IS21 family transposase [Gemmataceae bacterium]